MSASYYEDFKQRKQDGVWHFLNRLIYVLFAFVVIAAIICGFMPLLRKQKEQVRREEELRAQIIALNETYNLNLRKEDWLKDPEYVAVIARDRLDLMKPEETIIRMDSQPAPAAPVVKSRHQ